MLTGETIKKLILIRETKVPESNDEKFEGEDEPDNSHLLGTETSEKSTAIFRIVHDINLEEMGDRFV